MRDEERGGPGQRIDVVTDMGRSVPYHEKLFGPSSRQGDLAVFRLARSPRFFAVGPVKAGEKPGSCRTASPYCGGSGANGQIARSPGRRTTAL